MQLTLRPFLEYLAGNYKFILSDAYLIMLSLAELEE